MSTPKFQLPIPKGFLAGRLRVPWELGVGSWELSRTRFFAWLLCVILATVGVSAQTPAGGLSIERVFGPEVPTGPYKHPACLTELANGDLYLVYYGGQGEYARDTAVFGSRLAKGSPHVDAAAGHRARSVPIARQRRRLAGARWPRVAVLRRPIRRDVVHVAHPGKDLARQRRHVVRRLHAARGRGDDGAQSSDRSARRRLSAAHLP